MTNVSKKRVDFYGAFCVIVRRYCADGGEVAGLLDSGNAAVREQRRCAEKRIKAFPKLEIEDLEKMVDVMFKASGD